METIIMKIILIVVAILGIYIIYRKKDKSELIINNVFWLFASWVTCLLLYFFIGIKYTVNLNFLAFGYIFLVWILFYVGQYLIERKKVKNQKEEKINFSKKLNLFPIFIVSTISVVLYALYIKAINSNIQIGVTRNINTNAFTTLLLLISNSSLVIWLYELAYTLLNDKNISWYGIISAIVYNIPGFIMSGRDALIIFAVATVIVFIYCGTYAKKVLKTKGKMFKKITKYFAYAGIIVLIYLVFLSSNRYGNNKDSVINMFKWSAGCEFSDVLKNIYYTFGGFGKVILNVIFYYSSQISKFALIFEEYDGPYMFGLYQLHYVSRMLPDSWNMDFSLVSEKLGEISNAAGLPGIRGFWETAIGYSIYDFGRIGTLFVSFISGMIVGKINMFCNKNKNILSILIQVFTCVAMFLTVEISPLFDYYYIFPAIWLVIIYILYKKENKILLKEVEEKR